MPPRQNAESFASRFGFLRLITNPHELSGLKGLEYLISGLCIAPQFHRKHLLRTKISHVLQSLLQRYFFGAFGSRF
jgi:hypothetical protein